MWEIVHHTLNDDGERGTSCIVTQLEAHPLTSNTTLAHAVFVRLTQDPDTPEADMLDAQSRLLGYAAGEPYEDGTLPRIHRVLCTECGSDQVAFTTRSWANCRTCGQGQPQGEAMLCSEYCKDCSAKALSA